MESLLDRPSLFQWEAVNSNHFVERHKVYALSELDEFLTNVSCSKRLPHPKLRAGKLNTHSLYLEVRPRIEVCLNIILYCLISVVSIPVQTHILVANVREQVVLPQSDLPVTVAWVLDTIEGIDAVDATVIFAALRRREELFLTQTRRALAQRYP
jgi:hypothetical protein